MDNFDKTNECSPKLKKVLNGVLVMDELGNSFSVLETFQSLKKERKIVPVKPKCCAANGCVLTHKAFRLGLFGLGVEVLIPNVGKTSITKGSQLLFSETGSIEVMSAEKYQEKFVDCDAYGNPVAEVARNRTHNCNCHCK